MNWIHIHMQFNYAFASLFITLPILLQMGHCNLVTKFPNEPEKEGRWWMNYLKTYRRSCWVPKGLIYVKLANLDIENTLLSDEAGYYLTSCILEGKGRPGILCTSEAGDTDEEVQEISIRDCVKNNGFSWSLFESFTNKIPLMALAENLEITNSEFERMKMMMVQDDNLIQRRIADPSVPHRPTFNSIRQKLQEYIDERNKQNDIEAFLGALLDAVTRYVTEHIMDVYNEVNQ